MVFRFTFTVAIALVVAHSVLGRPFHRVRKQIPKENAVARSAEAARPASEPQDAFAEEERRYEAVKENAKTDSEIQALKDKCDSASGAEGARKASTIYYRALFQKIREMDPSLTDRANQAEVAIVRRLNE